MAVYEITVTTNTRYFEEKSEPSLSHYVFLYNVIIKNTGTTSVQLISRNWIITDANGHVREIHGLGVIGCQPFLLPNEQFEYTSGISLLTPHGTMRGKYFCVSENGWRFEKPIQEFKLSLPH
jgi:ApaG protein